MATTFSWTYSPATFIAMVESSLRETSVHFWFGKMKGLFLGERLTNLQYFLAVSRLPVTEASKHSLSEGTVFSGQVMESASSLQFEASIKAEPSTSIIGFGIFNFARYLPLGVQKGKPSTFLKKPNLLFLRTATVASNPLLNFLISLTSRLWGFMHVLLSLASSSSPARTSSGTSCSSRSRQYLKYSLLVS